MMVSCEKNPDCRRYMLITCAVLARECYHCAARSPNAVDIRIVEQGLHDIGCDKMSAALQREIDSVDKKKYEAVLLGYGLCNNGIRNLRAPIPMVVPRAHDCITLLMGSRAEYQKYFDSHPGTYFRSVGWMERAESNLSNPRSTTRTMGIATYDEYVEKYGEENAQYLMQTLNDHLKNYSRVAYIDTGIPHTESHERAARHWGRANGWEFTKINGDVRLIADLTAGRWDAEDFLVVPPGHSIEPSYDDTIVKVGEH
ncbi:MAG: DUF1638 domain-containing protein [Chitinivibrionales bacterium]|nr:DUF1638 domain-containing protein [Chitinivibrionales bacterium]